MMERLREGDDDIAGREKPDGAALPPPPPGGGRNVGRKPLIFLDSEKEMQGNANVFSLFSTLKTASKPVAARS